MDDQEITLERRHSIRSAVAEGMVDGFKEINADKDLVKKFWRGGFEELRDHSANDASQWVGKRVFTWIISFVVVAGLGYLVKSGAIK